MKRVICIVLICVLMTGLLSACDSSSEKKLTIVEEIRIAANNMQNRGAIATDGKWLYFDGNNQGMYKVRLEDGTEKSLVSTDIDPWHLTYVDGEFYFRLYSSYDTIAPYQWDDNKEKSKEITLDFKVFEDCFQTDGEYYYVNNYTSGDIGENGVYRVSVDDPQNYTKIMEGFPYRLILQGDYLYAISHISGFNGIDNPYYGTWRIDLDGGNPIKVLDSCPVYLIVTEDRVYYDNEDDVVCAMDLDGSNKKIYADARTDWGLNVIGDYIVYIDANTSNIHRMNKDGSENIELNVQACTGLHVAGEWLVYQDDTESRYYKINIDGTINCPIDDPVAYKECVDMEYLKDQI